MVDFSSLSILLIHRELLSERKGLINPVHDGVSSGLRILELFKRNLKEIGKIKGVNCNILKNSKRPFVWRQIVSSFKPTILREADCL